MIDTEIEVFRADTRASRGITAERLANLVSFDCEAHPVGCVVGHPKSDSPAEGRITGFRLDGNKLFASLKGVTSKIVDGIKDGSILNRSMAFFGEDDAANPTPGKLAPRHLGFLGASAPGIPGMSSLSKALAFAADDATGENLLIEGDPAPAWIEEAAGTPVIFTAKDTDSMERTPEQIAADDKAALDFTARENAITEREKAATARIRTAFEASNVSAIDSLVLAGKVLPAEADGLKLAFNAFDPEADDLTFGAGDKATKGSAVSHLLTFMAGLPKRVPIGDRTSPSKEFDAGERPDLKDPKQFNAAAEKMAKEKNLTFDAAAAILADEIEG